MGERPEVELRRSALNSRQGLKVASLLLTSGVRTARLRGWSLVALKAEKPLVSFLEVWRADKMRTQMVIAYCPSKRKGSGVCAAPKR